jgi:hypothetical protein
MHVLDGPVHIVVEARGHPPPRAFWSSLGVLSSPHDEMVSVCLFSVDCLIVVYYLNEFSNAVMLVPFHLNVVIGIREQGYPWTESLRGDAAGGGHSHIIFQWL